MKLKSSKRHPRVFVVRLFERDSMTKLSTAVFVASLFCITSMSCSTSTVPTAELTPTEVAARTPKPMLAIPPGSLPLSGEWRFSIDPDQVGEKQGWAKPDFDDSAWATVNVPHTWNVMPEYSDYE